ncbi:protein DOG1-like 2 [Musa acuminata AAA Group]|uniref:DOG1 domain-containing protein n=1 Tax=Musa acuminata subsp. malaccensis TaxID=214687 RepID=A0A804HQH2_MUSAM|nr:PREDICTED: transcription factor HBP-1b(c1)-like [Musa acuminata subsp. malaccensis]
MDSDEFIFVAVWPRELSRLRRDLRCARGDADRALVDRAIALYECFFRARSTAARSDPVRAYAAPWATALERAAHWVAGWRPNALIHLLYSESSLRFESQLPDLLLGVHSGDLGDLSSAQLGRIDELQRRTIRGELEISAEMAAVQEGLAEPFPRSDAELEGKVGELTRVMERADELRLRTLREVVDILEPVQAVDLLVAAADLEIGLREFGLSQDGSRVGPQGRAS